MHYDFDVKVVGSGYGIKISKGIGMFARRLGKPMVVIYPQCKDVSMYHKYKPTAALKVKDITEEKLEKVRKLNDLAAERGQSLAQMSIDWVLRNRVTSVLIGASKVEQIVENVKALDHMEFTEEELNRIEEILK